MSELTPNPVNRRYSANDIIVIKWFLSFQIFNIVLWYFISENYLGLITSLFVCSAALVLFFVGKNTSYRYLLRAISILLFFHFLILPWIYVAMITINPNSIIIDNDVFSNVNTQVQADILESYQPAVIDRNLTLLNKIDSSIDKNSKKLDWLISGNLYLIKGYALKLTDSKDPERNWSTLSIFDQYGRLLVDFNYKNFDVLKGDVNDDGLKALFSKLINETKQKKQSYLSETLKIKHKDIWTYNRILPYSINIFNSKTIKPVSGLANVVVFFHQVFVVVILLGAIGALVRDILIKK